MVAMQSEGESSREHVDRIRVLQDGLFAGLIGAITVIVVFFLHDLAVGQPLRTPSILGALLFQGQEAAETVGSNLELSIAYNGVHVLVWLCAGFLASYLVSFVDQFPKAFYIVFVAIAFVFFAFLFLDAALGVPVLGRLQLWTGGVLGAAAMGAFLWWRHPGALKHLEDVFED